MTSDDILRMARDSGLAEWYESVQAHGFAFANPDRLMRFAHLVAAHEREQCAAIARQAIPPYEWRENQRLAGNTARSIERDIRARGAA